MAGNDPSTPSLRPSPEARAIVGFLLVAAPLSLLVARYFKTPLAWVAWLLVWAIIYRLVLAYRYSRHKTQLELNARSAEILESAFLYVLYLRPFMTASRLWVENGMEKRADRFLIGSYWDIELALSLAVEPHARLLAIGGGDEGEGAAKLAVDDEHWRELLADRAARSFAIVMVPLPRPSTLWEVGYLFEHPGLLDRTLFLMPPTSGAWWQQLSRRGEDTPMAMWQKATRELAGRGIRLPPYRRSGAWLRFDANRELIGTYSLFGSNPELTWTLLACAGMNSLGGPEKAAPAFAELAEAGERFEAEARKAMLVYYAKWALWFAVVGYIVSLWW